MLTEADSYREAFLQALLQHDARAAEIVTREAIDSGLDEVSISDRVIAPALLSVCEMGEGGLVDTHDEEEAAQISIRVLALQREVFRRALQRAGEEILLAELEGDPKTARLATAAEHLRRAGFRVRYLGAGVPLATLVGTVARGRPHAVVLNVTTRDAAVLADYALDEIELASSGTKVLVGGPGVPVEPYQGEGRITWDTPADLVAKVDALAVRPSLN